LIGRLCFTDHHQETTMPIELTADGLRAIFPKAPQPILDALLARQDELTKAGVNHTRQRLAYALANAEHETGGFTIKNLTESIAYTAERAAQIWPSRFKDANGKPSAAVVRAKYGTAPGWQLKLFVDVYGSRMGNRPGTSDGSTFIGRGAPQITGRDGYRNVGQRCGRDLVAAPVLACAAEHQAAILAGFIDWKGLNAKADVGDWKGYVKAWNGGHIGMADREARLAGNDPVIARFANVERIKPVAKALPGAPPTPAPPKDVVDAATKKERAAVKVGTGGTVVGGAGEAAKKTTTTTEQPAAPPALLSPLVTWSLIGAGVAVVIVAAILIARKKAVLKANWF
jgi:putative chitinase